jgi:hypothetical protein
MMVSGVVYCTAGVLYIPLMYCFCARRNLIDQILSSIYSSNSNPEDYAFPHLPGFELDGLAGLAGYKAAGLAPVRVSHSTGVHCTGLLIHCASRFPKLVEILHFSPRFTAAHGLPARLV